MAGNHCNYYSFGVLLMAGAILTKGGEKMAKTIKSIGFTQNDEALVEKITIYHSA